MATILQTPRLVIRHFQASDADGLFALDGDTEVLRYLWENPMLEKQEAVDRIQHVQAIYARGELTRWAVELKATGRFIGWAGLLKIKPPYTINGRSDYYDLGYRFLREHWGQGYATEAAAACANYAFDTLNLECLYAITMSGNSASQRILQKLGFQEKGAVFMHEGSPHHWFELRKVTPIPDA